MSTEFNHLPLREQLEAENNVLKLKLMLENGASFGYHGKGVLSPEVENDFLHRILEFEKSAPGSKKISVFEHLGKPCLFKPVAEIPIRDIDREWEKLREHLEEHAISVAACSPNISNRELYRFTIEELFLEEIDDFHIPGAIRCFIYDEFHDDPAYAISRMIEDYFFAEFFQKKYLFSAQHYATKFYFNEFYFRSWNEFEQPANKFKSFFDQIDLETCIVETVNVENYYSIATGVYRARAVQGSAEVIYQGKFAIQLTISELGYWQFEHIDIDGFTLA